MTDGSKKVAILFRYGAVEHVDFLPALPALVHHLMREGCEVHHFGFRGKGSLPEDLRTSLKVHAGPFRVNRSKRGDKWIKAVLWLLYLKRLGKRLEEEGFDQVFVDETLPLSAWMLRKTYTRSLSFTVHDFFTEIYLMPHPPLRRIGRWLQRTDLRTWRELDAVCTRVDAAKRALTEQGVPANRIHVVPDSVDSKMFHPCVDSEERARVRKRLGLADGDVVMVHHGIMHPNKGNDRLVRALFRLRYKLPTLKLVLIGDGAERRDVERNRGIHGIEDRVLLTGWLPGLADIAEVLRACDIGLVMRKGVPGDHFHVTSTLVHNLASGLPILAARLDGIAEVVEEGRQGMLFDPECGEEFDENLTRLVTDVELRRRMGAEARTLAETRFSRERIAAAYAKALTTPGRDGAGSGSQP